MSTGTIPFIISACPVVVGSRWWWGGQAETSSCSANDMEVERCRTHQRHDAATPKQVLFGCGCCELHNDMRQNIPRHSCFQVECICRNYLMAGMKAGEKLFQSCVQWLMGPLRRSQCLIVSMAISFLTQTHNLFYLSQKRQVFSYRTKPVRTVSEVCAQWFTRGYCSFGICSSRPFFLNPDSLSIPEKIYCIERIQSCFKLSKCSKQFSPD